MEDKDLKKFFDDVKDLIKSIGTSSSINEERDERSVENYVRTGGNTMENTTEPDPQGDIAVTKAYPDASSDSKNVIGSATNPNGDIAVSDAPEGPVPTQETIPSDATSAIAPTSEEMAEPVEKADAAKCESCGQAMPVAKSDDSDADELVKAADEPESKEEAVAETPADEKAEMKKSLWGGAFAPRK
jgi:hypothetical protein